MEGFTGDQCFTDINECESLPCLNNGNCIDGVNTYECECLENEFEGETCEIEISIFGSSGPEGNMNKIVIFSVIAVVVGLLGLISIGVIRVGKAEGAKKDRKSKYKSSAFNNTKTSQNKTIGNSGKVRKRKRKIKKW